jgi:mRNA-degrading endonuclease YafQ of YafQ-DinJ toxin-antitoxin module
VLSPLPPAPPQHFEQQQQQQAAGLTALVTRLLQRWQQVSGRLQDHWGHLLYNYFNWRQDNTAKDLLLIFTLFFSFVMLGSCTHRWVIDDAAERGTGGLWNDIYQASACRTRLGQQALQPTAQMHQNALQQQLSIRAAGRFSTPCLQMSADHAISEPFHRAHACCVLCFTCCRSASGCLVRSSPGGSRLWRSRRLLW